MGDIGLTGGKRPSSAGLFTLGCLHINKSNNLRQKSIHSRTYVQYYIYIYILYSNTMFACMCVCGMHSWTDLAIFFSIASSWSAGGFRPKSFGIRDPVFPEIRKNLDIVEGVEIEL